MAPVKAHFDGKVFVPEAPVDLPKDTVVLLRVEVPAQTPQPVDALTWMSENAINDDSLPTDLSQNSDHYLYGKPKRNDL